MEKKLQFLVTIVTKVTKIKLKLLQSMQNSYKLS